MKFLSKLIGLNVPEIQVLSSQEENQPSDGKNKSDNSVASITFVLCNNGDINISCDWVEESMQVAKVYGSMLYHLNQGSLKTSIADVLIGYATSSVTGSTFIREVLQEWERLYKKNNNTPLISPSQVLSGENKGVE